MKDEEIRIRSSIYDSIRLDIIEHYGEQIYEDFVSMLNYKIRKQDKQTFAETLDVIRFLLKNREYIICKECGTIAYGDGKCHCGKNEISDGWIISVDLFLEELKQSLKQDKPEVEE